MGTRSVTAMPAFSRRFDLQRIVRHQTDARDAEIPQNLRAEIVVSMVCVKTQVLIGFHGVVTGVLQFVSEQLVHQPDPAPFLKLIDQDAVARLRDCLLSERKLIAAIAPAGMEDIAGQALRVNPDEGRVFRLEASHHQGQRIVGFVREIQRQRS